MPARARGTTDLCGAPLERALLARDALLQPARRAGFSLLETPLFEDAALFARSAGASSDLVSKEMFCFSRDARTYALRPEGTAGVIRALVDNGSLSAAGELRSAQAAKVCYCGPMFRAETPQAGRFRQFTQAGVEAVGVDDPLLDAQVVALLLEGLAAAGLASVELRLNTIGCTSDVESCRTAYLAELRSYLERRSMLLCADCRARSTRNALRVLDCKDPACQAVLDAAPRLAGFLCSSCDAAAASVRAGLDALGVRYRDWPRLVRGLDYYQKTAFEVVVEGSGAQNAVAGGGRFRLPTEEGVALGVGWAVGVERVLAATTAQVIPARADAVVVGLGEPARLVGLELTGALRRAGLRGDLAFGRVSLRSALRSASASGARFAVIIGARDLEAGVAQVRDLDAGEQRAVVLAEVPAMLRAARCWRRAAPTSARRQEPRRATD